ncbi:TIGR03557 family F420-dependent LLM class oxidoreductase [Schumannella luteola]|uniref:G6PDH family F420-dependent oxidoreductase n=1 Tax=Schumannella luteola TaxID=472059 RepID=A0A852YC83_9MICO|nr:TIGR03557 family F420-dependent LLM class oxidoreductase [Schumannella luteola]NYG98940.1 G6PDH family F420-dependent oxidoreductase [Schumannella luteola]TPX06314.1 TIGR03557 family F420-dependent LLM class oxidoreductase [Schumannella luteola]
MTLQVGYAAMLEQFAPLEVLDLAERAEKAGFVGVMASDHFQPWVPQQGQAAFVWNVLSALGQRIHGSLGTGVTAPTFRWHPAMVAQASATLGALYPGRHWLGLGSGEAINDHITGQYWPEAAERIDRMFEAVDVIKKLFSASLAGRDAKHDGRYFKLESTRLWTMPEAAPPILVATGGPITAKRAGRTVDGLITESVTHERAAQLLTRFAEGARESGRDASQMPKVLRLHLSWAATDERAVANALHQWPNAGLRFPKSDIRSPHELEQMARMVRPEDFAGRMIVSADPDVHRAEIQRYADLGFDRIHLHNVGRNQAEFIDVFAREVLPALRS